jgi:hypothetical protein
MLIMANSNCVNHGNHEDDINLGETGYDIVYKIMKNFY